MKRFKWIQKKTIPLEEPIPWFQKINESQTIIFKKGENGGNQTDFPEKTETTSPIIREFSTPKIISSGSEIIDVIYFKKNEKEDTELNSKNNFISQKEASKKIAESTPQSNFISEAKESEIEFNFPVKRENTDLNQENFVSNEIQPIDKVEQSKSVCLRKSSLLNQSGFRFFTASNFSKNQKSENPEQFKVPILMEEVIKEKKTDPIEFKNSISLKYKPSESAKIETLEYSISNILDKPEEYEDKDIFESFTSEFFDGKSKSFSYLKNDNEKKESEKNESNNLITPKNLIDPREIKTQEKSEEKKLQLREEKLEESQKVNETTQVASLTPQINENLQYNIPFSILRSQKEANTNLDPKEAQKVIKNLEETLEQFGIEGQVVGIQRGPIITRYEIKLAPGTKVSKILNLTDEIAMALEAIRVRIEAPIPGRATVGIEVPNRERVRVLLGDLINNPNYQESEANLPLPLGKDIAGNVIIEDLSRMPHLLIAGATGSGKSVAVNAFITNWILHLNPENVRFLLIDPKLVELSQYNDIPHLIHPVITEPQKAVLALNWAVEEMERRYEDLVSLRVRDIRSYNEKVLELNQKPMRSQNPHQTMPYIVLLIDELGDLMMIAGKEVESNIIRLSQKARAIGIHLVLATQRPSVDVITALIKANCPARIALQVAQKTDSRTIIEQNGAETLLGQGDLLFRHPNKTQLMRVQAPFVSDEEVDKVVEKARSMGKPNYIILTESTKETNELENEEKELVDEALKIIRDEKKASASYLQRRLRIGYNKAARLIESFEAKGYIGPQIGSKPREIFI